MAVEPLVQVTVDGEPFEAFTEVSFRAELSEPGAGMLVGDPEDPRLQGLDGREIALLVDGVPVASFVPDGEEFQAEDHETVEWSGRGSVAVLERAVVVPSGFPSFSVRERSFVGQRPLSIFLTLLGEAQGRGVASEVSPSFDAVEDSAGVPWDTVYDVELDPGVDLFAVFAEMCEVEGAVFRSLPGGVLDVRRTPGVDRPHVVLVPGRHVQESRREKSWRDVRGTVYVEAATGVSVAASGEPDADGEIWVEAQDFQDPSSRDKVADLLVEQLEAPKQQVTLEVGPDCGVFSDWDLGDDIRVEVAGVRQTVRVVAVAVTVTPDGFTEVELTVLSQQELREQRLDRAIEAKADVRLAASSRLQRRHGLIRADRIETGSLRVETVLSSSNFVSGSQGWRISGDGDVEFSDGVFRGALDAIDITGATITGGTITGASISGGTFTGGTVSDGSISASAFTGGSVSGTTITGTDFIGGTASFDGGNTLIDDDGITLQSSTESNARLVWKDGTSTRVRASYRASAGEFTLAAIPITRGRFNFRNIDFLTQGGFQTGFARFQHEEVSTLGRFTASSLSAAPVTIGTDTFQLGAGARVGRHFASTWRFFTGSIRALEANTNTSFVQVWASEFDERSSQEVKRDIVPVTHGALDAVAGMTVARYYLKDKPDGDKMIGIIAESLPDDAIAYYDDEEDDTNEGERRVFGNKHGALQAYTVGAIQELAERVTALEEGKK